MNVLFISPSFPNDLSRIRTKNILTVLKKQNCKITLISLYKNEEELTTMDEIKKITDEIILFKQPKIISLLYCLIGLFLPVPLRTSYVFNFKLHNYLKHVKKDFDLVYIKRLRMAQYGKHFDKNKLYVDITDSLTKYYDRISKQTSGITKLVNLEELLKHKLYEIKVAKKYKTVICSNEDKKYLENKNNIKLKNMIVLDNSIDTSKWNNNDIKINQKGKRTKLVFSGMMDYEPNILAAKFIINEVMPLLSDKYEISFVGKNCPEELLKYKSIRIHFTGFVEDMKEELEKYDIYLCPIIAGSGVKNKILQASCVGLPIVSTKLGIEGINKEFKKYVFLGDTPKNIVKQIEKVNDMKLNDLRKNVLEQQKYIENNYDINVAIKKIL